MQDSSKPSTLTLITVGIFLIGCIAFLVITPPQKARKYDCSISEISPDYPIEVKEGCRKLRAENSNKDLQKPK